MSLTKDSILSEKDLLKFGLLNKKENKLSQTKIQEKKKNEMRKVIQMNTNIINNDETKKISNYKVKSKIDNAFTKEELGPNKEKIKQQKILLDKYLNEKVDLKGASSTTKSKRSPSHKSIGNIVATINSSFSNNLIPSTNNTSFFNSPQKQKEYIQNLNENGKLKSGKVLAKLNQFLEIPSTQSTNCLQNNNINNQQINSNLSNINAYTSKSTNQLIQSNQMSSNYLTNDSKNNPIQLVNLKMKSPQSANSRDHISKMNEKVSKKKDNLVSSIKLLATSLLESDVTPRDLIGMIDDKNNTSKAFKNFESNNTLLSFIKTDISDTNKQENQKQDKKKGSYALSLDKNIVNLKNFMSNQSKVLKEKNNKVNVSSSNIEVNKSNSILLNDNSKLRAMSLNYNKEENLSLESFNSSKFDKNQIDDLNELKSMPLDNQPIKVDYLKNHLPNTSKHTDDNLNYHVTINYNTESTTNQNKKQILLDNNEYVENRKSYKSDCYNMSPKAKISLNNNIESQEYKEKNILSPKEKKTKLFGLTTGITNKEDENKVWPYYVDKYLKYLFTGKVLKFKEANVNKEKYLTNKIIGYSYNTNNGIIRTYNEDRITCIGKLEKPKSKHHIKSDNTDSKFSNLSSNQNEDWPEVSYFAIFDGHGGDSTSEFLCENLHNIIVNQECFPSNVEKAIYFGFKEAEEIILSKLLSNSLNKRKKSVISPTQATSGVLNTKGKKHDSSGSCAIIALIVNNKCYVANVGDSRALFSVNEMNRCYNLTNDHKPEDNEEKNRIHANGGKIWKVGNNPQRVIPGGLSVFF